MKVTEVGQKFKVKIPPHIKQYNQYFKENTVYTCDHITKYEGLENEIYVGEHSVIDEFTTVIEEHTCKYSKSMKQRYPRLCVVCGKPENEKK